MPRALRAWAINRGGKNSVRNLRYGPRTRLVRGMYQRNQWIHDQSRFIGSFGFLWCSMIHLTHRSLTLIQITPKECAPWVDYSFPLMHNDGIYNFRTGSAEIWNWPLEKIQLLSHHDLKNVPEKHGSSDPRNALQSAQLSSYLLSIVWITMKVTDTFQAATILCRWSC